MTSKRRTSRSASRKSNEEEAPKRRRKSSESKKDTKSTTARKSNFKYRKPSKEAINKHQKQSGTDFDSYISQEFSLYRPKEGDLSIRILPATWEDAEYWAYPIYVHYDVGPDSGTYLCRNKMLNEPCPICEESAEAMNDQDTEYGKELKPKKRMLVWVVDRDNEEKGPMPWAMPWSLDRDISKLIEDRRTGEILLIDNPDEGYDVEFTFEKGQGYPYKAVQIARNATPISDDPDEMDEWLGYIEDNPLPDLLNFYDYDHIDDVFSGNSAKTKPEEDASDDDDDDQEEAAASSDSSDSEADSEEEDDDDLPWKDDDDSEEEPDSEEEEGSPDVPDDDDSDAGEEEEEQPRRRRRARSETASSSRKKRSRGRSKLRDGLKDED